MNAKLTKEMHSRNNRVTPSILSYRQPQLFFYISADDQDKRMKGEGQPTWALSVMSWPAVNFSFASPAKT